VAMALAGDSNGGVVFLRCGDLSGRSSRCDNAGPPPSTMPPSRSQTLFWTTRSAMSRDTKTQMVTILGSMQTRGMWSYVGLAMRNMYLCEMDENLQ
jgi:hypothetical protein